MSLTARWVVGMAGLFFAAAGFAPFTASQHFWTAIVLGAVVGVPGFLAARRTSWLGALLAFAGLVMIVASIVGGVQTGLGHVAFNLLTGAAVIALTLFVHEPEGTKV